MSRVTQIQGNLHLPIGKLMDLRVRKTQQCFLGSIPLDQCSRWIHDPRNEQKTQQGPSTGVKPTNPAASSSQKKIYGSTLTWIPLLIPLSLCRLPLFQTLQENPQGFWVKICGWKMLPLEWIKPGTAWKIVLIGEQNPSSSFPGFFLGWLLEI